MHPLVHSVCSDNVVCGAEMGQRLCLVPGNISVESVDDRQPDCPDVLCRPLHSEYHHSVPSVVLTKVSEQLVL